MTCEAKTKLDGKVAVVTGGGSGMGYEAAKNLARQGARVIIASRNATKLEIARDQIRAETGNLNVDYRLIDLESFRSVRQFSHEIEKECRLDMLINNAGGFGLPDRLTSDGLPLMMQVNFFGGFLLTYLLLPMLKSSAPSRIINSSAVTSAIGEIDFNHWNDIGRYSISSASGNSKLATELSTVEWARRLNGTGVTANSFDPFFVNKTEIPKHLPKELQPGAELFMNLVARSRDEVGQEMAYYASATELEKSTGLHFQFCIRWRQHRLAQNLEMRKKLWNEAKRIVNITSEEDWEASEFTQKSFCDTPLKIQL